jgi:hypothetical protein
MKHLPGEQKTLFSVDKVGTDDVDNSQEEFDRAFYQTSDVNGLTPSRLKLSASAESTAVRGLM